MNANYIEPRNKLIKEAAAHADLAVGKRPVGSGEVDEWAGRWNAVFHPTMDELALKRKISNVDMRAYNEQSDN